VELLLEHRDVDPDFPDDENRTPLWCAAERGHKEVAKLLLGHGDVDPNHPDVNGVTPPACSAAGGHEGVVKLLLEWEDFRLNHHDDDEDNDRWLIRFAPKPVITGVSLCILLIMVRWLQLFFRVADCSR